MVGRGGCGQFTTGGKESHSVGNAVTFGGRNIAGVCSVVLHRWADKKSWGSMVCPGWSVLGPIMDYDAAPGWGEGCSVKVEVPMDLGIGRDVWLDPGRSEEIEGDEAVWDEKVPAVVGERGIRAT